MSSARHANTKIQLAHLPTPIVELTNLSRLLNGPRLLMKRDDLTGLAMGGNKTRKLEYILKDALDGECDSVITAGAQQSNHCRQTAAAAAQLGLECHLLLGGVAPQEDTGNLLLSSLLGAHIHWGGEDRKGEGIPALKSHLESLDKKPYVVPYGGSSPLGALAYVKAVEECAEQTQEQEISHIVFATSSGGTHAGMALGKALTKGTYQLTGINIDKDEPGSVPFAQRIYELAQKTNEMFDLNCELKLEDICVNDDYLGKGYGFVSETEQEAIALLAAKEGILLDPVYTGRAMAGLIDMIRQDRFANDETVLFWHTGGAPALFA